MSQLPSLREQLKNLEQIQEIDLKIDVLKKNKEAIPAALKSLEVALTRAELALTQKNNAITEIEKTQRQNKAAIDINADRTARANTKVEGVNNGTEFNAAKKEFDQLRKLAASLDEQTKKLAADLEKAQKDLVALTATRDQAKAALDAESAKLGGESGKFDADIKALTASLTQFTSGVDARTLALYNRVRAGRAGMGVSHAMSGRCKACNMVVPAQMFNEVQKATNLLQCPSCFRILLPSNPA